MFRIVFNLTLYGNDKVIVELKRLSPGGWHLMYDGAYPNLRVAAIAQRSILVC